MVDEFGASRRPAGVQAAPAASDGLLELPAALQRERLLSLPRTLGEVVRILRGSGAPGRPAEPAAGPEVPVPPGAAFVAGEQAEADGTRRFRAYLPASLGDGAPEALVMMLHGCQQTPEDFAIGTGMNRLAEAHRLIVVYPGQSERANARACWNWFRPGHQARDRGEPAILAGLARRLAAEQGIGPDRTFVAGLSAGGAMAAVLGATYPDVFAAVGVHSGLAQGSARDVLSALAAMQGEVGAEAADALPVPLIVFHGDADEVVHPANADRLAAAGRDGQAARTISGTAGGRDFTRWVDRGGDRPALEYWTVAGAGHAWSGGDPAGSFADPTGPDASAEMVRFFLGTARQPSTRSSA